MKVVIDSKIPFIKGVLEKYAEVVYLEGRQIVRKDILDADALIIRTRTRCNRALLEGTKVRFIATATIGYDHIDTVFCRAAGITWTNAEGCNSSSVEQYLASVLFHLAGKKQFALSTKSIGVVGVGNVGKKVARLCAAIGMRVFLNDPPRERRERSGQFISLDDILDQADIITLHVPLNREGEDKTLHLLDEKSLRKIRSDQLLINTSRGEVVDNEALRIFLRRNGLSACALDVWENEPVFDRELLELVDIGTPHIAGYSADGKALGTSMSVRAYGKFFGLGLQDWYPEHVPLPAQSAIELDCKGLDRENVIGRLVRCTYDVVADDQRLRNAPQDFEKLRGEYPLRREFPAYTVSLLNADDGLKGLAGKIGFNIVNDSRKH